MTHTREGLLCSLRVKLRFALILGLTLCFTVLLPLSRGRFSFAGAEEKSFIRFSKPEFLSFEELVELEKNDTPAAPIAAKLERLLTTPIISNEAGLDGAKPKRPTSPELGPFLRAVCWNIERGIRFDAIRTALAEPEKFDTVLAEKKDPNAKPLSPEELQVVKSQLERLQSVDLLILNEADYGVTRTDYRDVARDLAKALKMNYAYGVEFLEIDPLNLGLEKVKMDDKDAEADIQKSFDVDKTRYLGMHGMAVLSRYPIRNASLRPLPVCYDWYANEKKEISKLESGRRAGANLAFMERITREVRRGGRNRVDRASGRSGISNWRNHRGRASSGEQVQTAVPRQASTPNPGPDPKRSEPGDLLEAT